MDFPGWWRMQKEDEESEESIPLVPPRDELALFAMRCAGGDVSLFRILYTDTDFADLVWMWTLRVFSQQ